MTKKILSLLPSTANSPLNRVIFNKVLQPFFENANSTTINQKISVDRESYSAFNLNDYNIDAKISNYQPTIQHNDNPYSFYDLITLAERYNINIEDFDNWGQCKTNSLKLPINYDKFANYKQYVWVGNNTPNYVVIRNSNIQIYEILINNARLINDDAQVAVLKLELINNLGNFDPLGGFDIAGFDNDDFDGSTTLTNPTTTNWESNNTWIHIDDIHSGVPYIPCTFPILEYSNKLELVKWIELTHQWSYRSSFSSPWSVSSTHPTPNEIQNGQTEIIDTLSYDYINYSTKTIYFSVANSIVATDKILVRGSNIRWTVGSIVQPVGNVLGNMVIVEANFNYFRFDEIKEIIKLSTYDVIEATQLNLPTPSTIKIKGDITGLLSPPGVINILDFFNGFSYQYDYTGSSYDIPSDTTTVLLDINSVFATNDLNGRFTVQNTTSKGDVWAGLNTHWCYNGIVSSNVIGTKTANTKTSLLFSYDIGENIDVIELGNMYPNSEQLIEVFINGKQYYNFVFGIYDNLVFTPASQEFQIINAIKLIEPVLISISTIVNVTIGADSLDDVVYENFKARVSQTEDVVANIAMIRYKQLNQSQSEFNLYPLFTSYDLSGNLLPSGINICRFKSQSSHLNEVLFVKELNRYIVVDNGAAIIETDLILNDQHIQYKIDTILSHLWSNTTNVDIQIEYVDQNGYGTLSTNFDPLSPLYIKVPEYLYSNINNIVSSTYTNILLQTHFNNVLSANVGIIPRVLDDINYIDNVVSNINIFDSDFPFITNQLLSEAVFDNVIDVHKQLRLMYLSTFFRSAFNTVTGTNLTNISAWYNDIYAEILTNDTLKRFNTNDLLHPITIAMLFNDFAELPVVVDRYITMHDGQLISYDKIQKLFAEYLPTFSKYNNIPVVPVVNDVYFDDNNFFKFNGTIWVTYETQPLLLQLLQSLETNLYNICVSTVDSVGIQNQTNIEFNTNVLYNEYASRNLLQYPFSNRKYFNQNDAFTWNYSNIDYNNIYSPLIGTPITSNRWGASYKEIYFKLFNTPYPNIEPWKLQQYSSKPAWWDGLYADITNTRLWNNLMWNNILNGVIPIGQQTYNNINGTGVNFQVDGYVFVPVNTSDIGNTFYALDELLPPFRSDLDALQNNVLINNINNINIDYVNSAESVIGFGTLQEWDWKEQISYPYDLLLILFKSDPTILHKFQLNLTNVLVNDNVTFYDSKLINSDIIKTTNINFVPQLYNSYNIFYNKQTTSYEFNNIDTSMSILPGSFIDNRVDIDIINDSNLSLQLKHNEFNVLKSITNFNISVQNINNAKRSELLHNYDFIITSTCSNVKQINVYESMYTDVIFLSEFVAEISPVVYSNLITGSKVIVTWDGYQPEEFIEQDDFYIIKRGSNTISLCRSVKELSLTNYVSLPIDYPYGVHLGQYVDDFTVLNKQITAQVFPVYSNIVNQTVTKSFPIVVNGIQELINLIKGYIMNLRADNIYESHFLYERYNETFSRNEDYKLGLEVLLADIYNKKNNRTLFLGSSFVYQPFLRDIFIESDRTLLPLNQSNERQDLSVMYDLSNQSIHIDDIIVFRDDLIHIETNELIGGGNIRLSTSQHIITLNNDVYSMVYKSYPYTVDMVFDSIATLNGVIEFSDGKFEPSFNEIITDFSNIFSNKTSQQFLEASKNVLGYDPSFSITESLNDTSSFEFWKESLSSKGSVGGIQPYKHVLSTSINVDALFAVKKAEFGAEFNYHFHEFDFYQKKYGMENSSYDFFKFNDIITKQYVDVILETGTFVDGVMDIQQHDKFKLKLDFNVNDPIVNILVPRFTTTSYVYNLIATTDVSKLEVFVNGLESTYTVSSLTNTTANINILLDDQIDNNIIIIIPTSVELVAYDFISISKIEFVVDTITFDANTTYALIGQNVVTPEVLLTRTSKPSLQELYYFNPVSNDIPFVDYVTERDPFELMYTIQKGVTNNSPNDIVSTKVGELWYKKSNFPLPYTCNKKGETYQVDFYGQSFIDDSSAYQLVKSPIAPELWFSITENNETFEEYNNTPYNVIMTRTRITESDPWSSWIEIEPLHERIVVQNTGNISFSITIGELSDICRIYVNGEFNQLLLKDGNVITINDNSNFGLTTIDIFILPYVKIDDTLQEYKREYSYTVQQENDNEVYYFWVNNYADGNIINANYINRLLTQTRSYCYGMINGNIIIFNNDYSLNNADLLFFYESNINEIWTLHSVSTNTTRISLILWEKLSISFIPVNKNIISESFIGVNNILITYIELINIINNILIDNSNILSPYTVEELVLTNTSTDADFMSLYDKIPSVLINDIVVTVFKTRPYDISSMMIFTSLLQLNTMEQI